MPSNLDVSYTKEVFKYLRSVPVGPYNESYRSLPTEVSERFIQEPTNSCRNPGQCFLDLNLFKHELQHHILSIPEREPVIDKLTDENFQALSTWMQCSDYYKLVIDGCQGHFQWTADLLLEIYDILQYLARVRNQGSCSTAVISHMCGPHKGDGHQQEIVLIQDLIAQLIETHQERLKETHQICDQSGHTMIDEPRRLWNLLSGFIFQSNISELTILLDQVNHMHYGSLGTEHFTSFVQNLDSFCKTLRQRNVEVKVLITSTYFEAARCFEDVEGRITMKVSSTPS